MKWLLPPVLLLIAILGIIGLRAFLQPFQIFPLPLNWLGGIAVIGGLAVTLAGSKQFQRVKTNINTFRNPDILVTSGVFAISRNPMYLGFCMILLGAAIMGNHLAGLGVVAAYFMVCQFWYIPYEEAAAAKQFGQSYEAYRSRVRRWI